MLAKKTFDFVGFIFVSTGGYVSFYFQKDNIWKPFFYKSKIVPVPRSSRELLAYYNLPVAKTRKSIDVVALSNFFLTV